METIPAALATLDADKVRAAAAKIQGESDAYFTLWLRLVNRRVAGTIGLGIDDIEDMPYFDMYDDGLSPADAAQEVLAAVGADW